LGTATTEAAAMGAAPFASLRFRTTVSSYQFINVEPLFYLYSSKYGFFEPVISENHRTCDFRKLSIIDIEPWKMNHIYKKKDNDDANLKLVQRGSVGSALACRVAARVR
jgi:hypothetical protein